MAATLATAIDGCVEPIGFDRAPDAKIDETIDETIDEKIDDSTDDGPGNAGSGGQSPGPAVTPTASGGAPAGSGGTAARPAVDAALDVGGSGGTATGGVVAGGSGGTGGIVATASGGTGGTGGVKTSATGSGGTMGGGTDAGTDSAPICNGANHLCGGTCVANNAVSSCGATSCSPCPVPSGGTATCDGNRCGIACTGGKSCGGKCIAAGACCADGDCQGDAGAAGKCNTATNSCQYPVCGNSMLEMGEQCDPPKSGSCSASCMIVSGPVTLYNFDANISPWTLYMTSPDRLAAKTTVAFDAQNGEGNSGALKVDAPFDDPNQKVEFQDTRATPLDLSGSTLRARVRLGRGLSDDTVHPGAIKLFAKSGADFDYASGVWTKLTGAGWADVTLVVDRPDFVQGPFAAAQVRQIGFELRVFSDTQRPMAAVVYLDSISR